jgi:hypothetical protein
MHVDGRDHPGEASDCILIFGSGSGQTTIPSRAVGARFFAWRVLPCDHLGRFHLQNKQKRTLMDSLILLIDERRRDRRNLVRCLPLQKGDNIPSID